MNNRPIDFSDPDFCIYFSGSAAMQIVQENEVELIRLLTAAYSYFPPGEHPEKHPCSGAVQAIALKLQRLGYLVGQGEYPHLGLQVVIHHPKTDRVWSSEYKHAHLIN